MSRIPFHARRLLFEGLETRSMMAGDVTVTVTNGVLKIQGDALSNNVELRQLTTSPSNGDWPGVRLQIMTPGGTINGQGSSLIVDGIKNGVVIGLGNGNNTLRAQNLQDVPNVLTAPSLNLPGTVSIGAGGGNDNILVSIRNAATTTVGSGNGADRITLYGWVNKLTVNSDPAPPANGTPLGANDAVYLSSVTASGPVVVNTGIGERDDVHVVGGSSFNETLNIALAESGIVFFGQANSTSSIPSLNGSTVVDCGSFQTAGVALSLTATIHGNFTANFGSGNDVFGADGTTCTGSITANLGAGNDTATFQDFISSFTTLDGGAGTDRLIKGANTDFGTESISGFESS